MIIYKWQMTSSEGGKIASQRLVFVCISQKTPGLSVLSARKLVSKKSWGEEVDSKMTLQSQKYNKYKRKEKKRKIWNQPQGTSSLLLWGPCAGWVALQGWSCVMPVQWGCHWHSMKHRTKIRVCVWGGGGKGLGVKSNFSDSKWTIQHPSVVCSPVIITILLSSLLVCTPYQVPHWDRHNHSGSLHDSPLRDLFTGVWMRLSLSMIQPFLALGEINPRGLGTRNSKATGSFWVLVLPIWKMKFLDHRGWLFGKYHREHGRVLGWDITKSHCLGINKALLDGGRGWEMSCQTSLYSWCKGASKCLLHSQDGFHQRELLPWMKRNQKFILASLTSGQSITKTFRSKHFWNLWPPDTTKFKDSSGFQLRGKITHFGVFYPKIPQPVSISLFSSLSSLLYRNPRARGSERPTFIFKIILLKCDNGGFNSSSPDLTLCLMGKNVMEGWGDGRINRMNKRDWLMVRQLLSGWVTVQPQAPLSSKHNNTPSFWINQTLSYDISRSWNYEEP